MEKSFDIVFIGSGPAGFTGAIKAAQLGASVAVIELGFLGGVCLNRGCIPTKSMLRSSQTYADIKEAYKQGVFVNDLDYDFSKIFELRTKTIEKIRNGLERTLKADNIEIINGIANVDKNGKLTVDTGNDNLTINYKHLIIATGSAPRTLPDIPENLALTSDTMLAQMQLPEKILIIGSGAIGTEWARILHALDKKVCMVELADRLAPQMDESISEVLARIFKKQKIEFYTGTSVEKIDGHTVYFSNSKTFEADKILVAIGRVPNLFGLENVPFEKIKCFIKTDEHFKTSMDNIYAVGDITGIQMLAHTAAAQSSQLVEYLLTGKEISINYKNIPAVIYGKPEIACVGYTEQQLKAENANYKVSKLPLTISAKAFIDEEFDGFIKVLSIDNKIVGAAIAANDASALLQTLTTAICNEITIDELEKIVYAHPTTTEALSEAILNINGKALFVPIKK